LSTAPIVDGHGQPRSGRSRSSQALAPTRTLRTRLENRSDRLLVDGLGLTMRTPRAVGQSADAFEQILLVPLVAGLAADAEAPANLSPRQLLGRELFDQL
jgi:hypothetical protein